MRFSTRFFRVVAAILLWVVFAVYAWQQLNPARAEGEFSYTIDMNYAVNADGTTLVSSTYRITNNTNSRVLASLQINTPTNDVTGISARYADGSPIPLSSADKTNGSLGYSYAYKEINLRFGDWPSGKGSIQTFTVAYTTSSLTDVKGASRTFYVPSLEEVGTNENYNITVSVPTSFGKMISTGIVPQIDGTDGDKVRYRFVNSRDLTRSFTLIFGDSTIYKADFAYPLKNTSSREQTLTVTLPPNTLTQKIYINRLDPQPTATRVDADGNILADYKVPARTTMTVHTDIAAQVTYQAYDLSKGGTKADIPPDLIKHYTGATKFWQTDDAQLRDKAIAATGQSTKVVDIIQALQKYTIDTLTYNNEKIKYNIRQGSYRALRNPENAVCLEYSDLMIALLRSQGIPARMPVGYAYAGSLKQSKSVSDSLHSWVEAYVPGLGWINLDPTWGEKYDTFGKSDLDHFTFAIWGRDDATPAAVMIDGQDMNYQYEATTVSYDSSLMVSQQQGEASATTYVILPWMSFVKYTVKAPGNQVGDNYAVLLKPASGEQQRIPIGKMAPLQVDASGLFIYGGGFANPTQLVFVQKVDTSDTVLAASTSSVVWWPAYISAGVITSIILLILVKLSIRRKKKFREAGKEQLSHGGSALAREAMEKALAEKHQADKLEAEKKYIEKK